MRMLVARLYSTTFPHISRSCSKRPGVLMNFAQLLVSQRIMIQGCSHTSFVVTELDADEARPSTDHPPCRTLLRSRHAYANLLNKVEVDVRISETHTFSSASSTSQQNLQERRRSAWKHLARKPNPFVASMGALLHGYTHISHVCICTYLGIHMMAMWA